MCGLPLGDICNPPGQANNNPTYLITELNPFKIVNVKVRFCSARNCLAMHQASVEKLGKYMFEKNTSMKKINKIREIFSKTVPEQQPRWHKGVASLLYTCDECKLI